MEIIRNSTYEAWRASLRIITEQGKETIDADNRVLKEIINLVIRINNPAQDIAKPVEVMKDLKKWEYPELDELEDVFFKKETSFVYHYTYGARIFNYADTKNQVDDFIIPLLKRQPRSRKALIVLYNPVIDSKIGVKETPSLISILFKITDGKLLVTTMIRSNDMFIGWPANIYQVYLLQRYVAQNLGLELGSLTTIAHSAHVFSEYNSEVEYVLKRK